MGFPGRSDDKESTCNVGDLGSIPGLGRSPGGGRATYSIILAWRIHMGLASYSPWGGKESDTTEQLNTTQLITMLLIPILQQSDSILHIYSFLIFFSIMIYHKTLF